VIGECVSGPAGYAQPTLYETIERGMATPIGRGPGRTADDVYAFGVLTMTLALGHPLCPGWSDQEIINAKIETGSYAALLGRERVPLGLMEPLRGLLCDNADDRWGIEELERWLEGRTSTPKQVMLPAKAQRAFRFDGQDFRNLRSLAHAFALSWSDAGAAIQEGDLDKWVQRSLSNDPQAPAVEHAFTSISSGDEGSRTRDQAIFRILLSLDPTAPLRYKQVRCVSDAFGQALAVGFADPELHKTFRELIRRRLLQTWIEHQPKSRREHGGLKRKLNRLSVFLDRDGPGFGLERCLYFMNPGWPCQSPLFKGVIVFELSQLLPALERIAAQAGPDDEPVDRHIAAFCAANMKMLPPQVLRDLDDTNERWVRRLAMLALLAEVQVLTGPTSLPGLAAWLVRLLEQQVQSVHNLPYRSALGQEVANRTQDGRLGTLRRLIDNRPARQRDSAGFAQAQALYRQAESEIDWLEEGGLTSDGHVTRGSQQASVLVAAVLSGIALVSITLAQVL